MQPSVDHILVTVNIPTDSDDDGLVSTHNSSGILYRLVYQEGQFPDKPEVRYGDGDGTVNIRSAKVCESVSCGDFLIERHM